eukprot:scaffold241238_cov24-Tisochrysis_lutea.AAC.2
MALSAARSPTSERSPARSARTSASARLLRRALACARASCRMVAAICSERSVLSKSGPRWLVPRLRSHPQGAREKKGNTSSAQFTNT